MKFITTLLFFLSLHICVSAQILEQMRTEKEVYEEKQEKEDLFVTEIDNSHEYRNVLTRNELSSRVAGGSAAYIGRKRAMTGMDGDIYLEREFKDAIVLTSENKKAYTKARYRVIDDEIEILEKGGELTLFKKEVKAVGIGEQVFVPRKQYDKEGKLQMVWLELLSEGAVNLYQQYTIRIQRSNYNPSLNTGNKNDEMLIEKKFYYSKADSKSIKKLKKGRTNVLDILKKRKNAVNEYARKNQLRWSKEEDLVKLFDFYNAKDKK